VIENLLPIEIAKPGFFTNGTTYQTKGRWREGNLVRFHEGTIQPIGGWAVQGKTGATMVGVPLAAVCWQFSDGTPYLAVGTQSGLYIIDADNVVYDITPASIQTPPFDWQLTTFGAYLIAVNSLRGDADLSLINTFVWTGNTATPATAAWTTSVGPAGAYSCFATPERFLVVVRGKDQTSHTARTGVDPLYSERRIYWASQEELIDFTSSDTNTGGDFDLQTEGRLVVGAASRGQSLIWSDVDLWVMNYIGGELIYSFQNVGRQCGIVGKRAFVLTDKGAFWMSRGKFFVYDGFARSIPCEVTDHVFGDFNEQRAHTVWTVATPRFNEVTWFYPSAGSQYPDRYVTFNHAEDHWVFGELERSCGVQQRFTNDVIDEAKPLFIDSTAHLFEHETGDERDSQAWLASGPIELGNGDRLMRLQGILPDEKVSGDVQLRIYGAMASDSLETQYGPYTLGPVTNLRLTARQVRVRLEEATATAWRVGVTRLAVRPAERRGIGPGTQDLVPASLEIVPDSVTLINGQHYTFQSIVRNAAGQVLDIEPDTWTSDNTSQIPVDTTGTVTALATPSSAHIQAFITSPALASNIAFVAVVGDDIPASITITPTAFDVVAAGANQTITAVVKNAAGQILTDQPITSWTTTDNTKITVASVTDLTAAAHGVAAGTATIRAHIGAIVSNDSVGTVTDPYYTHTFTAPGSYNFVVSSGSGNVRALLVAGGGGGGGADGTGVFCGGGGAGGVLEYASIAVTPQSYPVAVGAHGAGGVGDHVVVANDHGDKGGDTTAFGHTATGGGGGKANLAAFNNDGGSGGGGCTVGGAATAGGTGIGGQGNAGGSGADDSSGASRGGGGGGAGAVGSNYITGAGGAGIVSTISGASVTYGKGGDGATGAAGGAVETGNTGNGGGGGGGHVNPIGEGGQGADGILIIRYLQSTGIVATGGVKVLHS
jgi:hypothetical protein